MPSPLGQIYMRNSTSSISKWRQANLIPNIPWVTYCSEVANANPTGAEYVHAHLSNEITGLRKKCGRSGKRPNSFFRPQEPISTCTGESISVGESSVLATNHDWLLDARQSKFPTWNVCGYPSSQTYWTTASVTVRRRDRKTRCEKDGRIY